MIAGGQWGSTLPGASLGDGSAPRGGGDGGVLVHSGASKVGQTPSLAGTEASRAVSPNIIPRSGHSLSRRDIDSYCLKVLYRLYRAGHVAYLVGGGVRDLLLGIQPKDFDVSTDAHPARMRKLFRNCVLIGRRFRLAHVRFGSTVIEVSTFRRSPEAAVEGGDDLLIKQDNTFGTPEDDALRRDFTINALFYDIGTFAVIDYVGGLHDLEDGCIRSIGDPAVRYQEDPVRMLRAVKFAARLDFDIVDADLEAIEAHGERVGLAAVPRLLEETYKLLRGGASAPSFQLLERTGLLAHLMPEVAEHTRRVGRDEESGFTRHLAALDQLSAGDDPPRLTNALLLAALLTPILEEQLGGRGSTWRATPEEVDDALVEAVEPVLAELTVARRDRERLRSILLAQPRLAQDLREGPVRGDRRIPPSGRPWFHEAVDLLAIGAALDEDLAEASAQWLDRAAVVAPVHEPGPARRRRRRPRPRH